MSDQKKTGAELSDEQVKTVAGGSGEGWEYAGVAPPEDRDRDGRPGGFTVITPKIPEIPFPGQDK